MKKVARNIHDIEREIVNQILISELCFDICKSISIIPGRGNDILPFYYNLNFSKGIISLHSLLLSTLSGELTIKNYIKQYQFDSPTVDINDFHTEITSISKSFKKILSISLRHKVCAHIDQQFKHTGFTNAYIMPKTIKKYISLIQKLKKSFFTFSHYAQNDYPFEKILNQSKSVTKIILADSERIK